MRFLLRGGIDRLKQQVSLQQILSVIYYISLQTLAPFVTFLVAYIHSRFYRGINHS